MWMCKESPNGHHYCQMGWFHRNSLLTMGPRKRIPCLSDALCDIDIVLLPWQWDKLQNTVHSIHNTKWFFMRMMCYYSFRILKHQLSGIYTLYSESCQRRSVHISSESVQVHNQWTRLTLWLLGPPWFCSVLHNYFHFYYQKLGRTPK